jgi:hypothetical protein
MRQMKYIIAAFLIFNFNSLSASENIKDSKIIKKNISKMEKEKIEEQLKLKEQNDMILSLTDKEEFLNVDISSLEKRNKEKEVFERKEELNLLIKKMEQINIKIKNTKDKIQSINEQLKIEKESL